MVDGKGIVIAEGELGRFVTAKVDFKTKVATEVVAMPQLTERAMDIAKADPQIQEILAQGATIYKVAPMFHFGARVTPTGEVEEFSGALALVTIAMDPSGVHGKSWSVYVDVKEGKVVDIITKDPAQTKSDPEGKWKIEYGEFEGQK